MGNLVNMTTTAKAPRVWCSCGRGFYNRAGCTNHGRKCPIETARHDAWIKAIEEGRSPVNDPAAMVQHPREMVMR